MAASMKRKDTVTAEDVRTVQFDRHRPGYHMEQVDQFLDLVAETMDEMLAMARPEQQGIAEPSLYDPEGAASRLMAAAQTTMDTMVHEAETYATTVRAEADAYRAELTSATDDYAGSTRTEADTYADEVRGAADSHAAAVKSAAAEEARKLAEDARSQLVQEMRELEATRSRLQADNQSLQVYLETEQARLGEILEGLRSTVTSADLGLAQRPSVSAVSVDDHPLLPIGDVVDVGEATQAVSAPVFDDEPASDDEPAFEAAAPVAVASVFDDNDDVSGDDAELDYEEPKTDELSADDLANRGAVESEAEDNGAVVPEIALTDGGQQDDAMEAAARSVFDLDDVVAEPEISLVDDDSEDELFGSNTTINLDAEPQWGEDSDDGDRFFAELGNSDLDEDDDAFGPVDDRTETAMTAFFDESDSRA